MLVVTSLFVFFTIRRHPSSTLFPYTTLFRSLYSARVRHPDRGDRPDVARKRPEPRPTTQAVEQRAALFAGVRERSEEHTSELQSHSDIVCRLLLEKKKIKMTVNRRIHSSIAH